MRKYTTTVRCAEPGCNECGHFGFDTKRDQRESKVSSKPWWCSRHTNREGVLGMNNLTFTATKTYEAIPSKLQLLEGKLFWNGTNGYAHGDGWKAWAKDFPPGTKIVMNVSAQVVLPAKPTQPEGDGAKDGADTKRMDWLEQGHCVLGLNHEDGRTRYSVDFHLQNHTEFLTVRAAIDAAMAGETAKDRMFPGKAKPIVNELPKPKKPI
jgi:hypothetical protein